MWQRLGLGFAVEKYKTQAGDDTFGEGRHAPLSLVMNVLSKLVQFFSPDPSKVLLIEPTVNVHSPHESIRKVSNLVANLLLEKFIYKFQRQFSRKRFYQFPRIFS